MVHNLTCLLYWQSWQLYGLSLEVVMGNYCWHTIRPGKVYESACVQYGCLLISSYCQGESKAKGKRPWLPWQHKSDSGSQDSLLLISFQPQISFHSAAIIKRKYYASLLTEINSDVDKSLLALTEKKLHGKCIKFQNE